MSCRKFEEEKKDFDFFSVSTEETSKYFSDKVIRSSRFGKVRDMTAKALTPGPPTPSNKRTYEFMPEMNDFEETIWLPSKSIFF